MPRIADRSIFAHAHPIPIVFEPVGVSPGTHVRTGLLDYDVHLEGATDVVVVPRKVDFGTTKKRGRRRGSSPPPGAALPPVVIVQITGDMEDLYGGAEKALAVVLRVPVPGWRYRVDDSPEALEGILASAQSAGVKVRSSGPDGVVTEYGYLVAVRFERT